NAGIIKDLVIGEPFTADTTAQNYGWRPVSFAVADPSEASARTQTLRIKCKTRPEDDNESPLYRDIVISLLPTQEMRVSCEREKVLLVSGEAQQVNVAIPDGLVESMFPLHFFIEAKNLTLTPDNTVEGNNLPVVSGTSKVGNYQTFHYQRTLEWAEYKEIDAKLDYEDETLWRTFSSYFKTNCEESATEIYVTNEFFYPDTTSFTNYESFRDPHYTTSIPRREGADVSVSAQLMTANQEIKPVYLELKGLVPADGSGIQQDSGTGEYYYTPTAQAMTFHFKTTVADGDVSVTLYSKDYSYEPAVLTPWYFRDMKIMDMATPSGNNRTGTHATVLYGHVPSLGGSSYQVLVGYFTDPGNPAPRVSVSDMSGIYTGVTSWNDSGNISSTAQDRYREKWFESRQGSETVSATFSAVGYVEETVSAPRYVGSLFSWDINNATLWTNFVNNNAYLTQSVTVNNVKAGFSLSITVPEGKAVTRHSGSNGIVLPAGGHYELEANISTDNSDTYLCYVEVFYYVSDVSPLRPRTVESEPDGSIYY
ncbi:MAG: hypothetical protein J6N54_03385, partial [Bacteroidales bacterium]|nr:hypothetical protein [Bacteroidales bacterium]